MVMVIQIVVIFHCFIFFISQSFADIVISQVKAGIRNHIYVQGYPKKSAFRSICVDGKMELLVLYLNLNLYRCQASTAEIYIIWGYLTP